MAGDSTICLGTSGSGVRITITETMSTDRSMVAPGSRRGRPRSVSCAAAVGPPSLTAVARRTASGTRRATATATSASASRGLYPRPQAVTERPAAGRKGSATERAAGVAAAARQPRRRGSHFYFIGFRTNNKLYAQKADKYRAKP
jgi:hypothetical protein